MHPAIMLRITPSAIDERIFAGSLFCGALERRVPWAILQRLIAREFGFGRPPVASRAAKWPGVGNRQLKLRNDFIIVSSSFPSRRREGFAEI
jgi:hypothetical protein